MQRFITDKELKILHYFYKKEEGYVREINKKIKLPEHTLLKYLKQLEEKDLLISQFRGNIKFFRINKKNRLSFVFFSYFDYLQLESLIYIRKEAIKDLIKEIKLFKLPYFMLLFGSTAKGNYNEKSDIDLIIVYEELSSEIFDKINKIKFDIDATRAIKIHTIIMPLKEFLKEKENKENYALQDALQTGYPIFGNLLFYEAIV